MNTCVLYCGYPEGITQINYKWRPRNVSASTMKHKTSDAAFSLHPVTDQTELKKRIGG
jgi:hypothetical protein